MSEEVSLWEKIKEDFEQPIKNDPALNSKLELFSITLVFGQL